MGVEDMKCSNSKPTVVEIENHGVVKTFCAAHGITMRTYVNHLIRDDIIRHGDVATNVRYFKEGK
jgi:hypothetical protein